MGRNEKIHTGDGYSDERDAVSRLSKRGELQSLLAEVVELSCRMPLDVPVKRLETLAKEVLNTKDVNLKNDRQREYDEIIREFLRKSTGRLQKAIQSHLDPPLTWLGTVSFFSLIKPNELSVKQEPPCRITYFHNNVKEGKTHYRLPIFFERTGDPPKVLFEARASKPGEDVEQRFQDLLSWMKCPPANLVCYLGSSISISRDKYYERLWGPVRQRHQTRPRRDRAAGRGTVPPVQQAPGPLGGLCLSTGERD